VSEELIIHCVVNEVREIKTHTDWINGEGEVLSLLSKSNSKPKPWSSVLIERERDGYFFSPFT